MHRMVSFVFKLIGITMVLLIVADTAFMLVDAYTTNSRIQAQANLMQMEIAKNNYMSDAAIQMFKGEVITDSVGNTTGTGFAYISHLSNVYQQIEFNETEVNQVKDYGDYHKLVITAVITPWHYHTTGRMDSLTKVENTSTINYTYTVPCLRYLK